MQKNDLTTCSCHMIQENQWQLKSKAITILGLTNIEAKTVAGFSVVDPVSRFTRKTQITGKTAEIPERPTSNREILMEASANCKNFY